MKFTYLVLFNNIIVLITHPNIKESIKYTNFILYIKCTILFMIQFNAIFALVCYDNLGKYEGLSIKI